MSEARAILKTYIAHIRKQAPHGVPETPHYGAMETLFNSVGKTLEPGVFCIIKPSGKEAGIPDGGLFTEDQEGAEIDAGGFTTKPASGACDGSEFIWQYDAYGNLLNDGTATYTYDAANRLASVTNAAGTTSYTYNGDGDRISQTVNGALTTYTLDTATPLTMVLAETRNGQTIHYLHGLDLVAQSDGTTTAYFAYDGLGSVRQLTDPAGAVQLAQTFDPYGNGYSKAGVAQTAWGYTGEQQDANGFVYLRARYYNPAQGRFSQRDTWAGNNSRPQSLNGYAYTIGNPILYTDPSGNDPWWCEEQYTGDPQKTLACYGWYAKDHNWSVSPGQRRAMAAQWANQWARVDWDQWKTTGFWGYSGPESGNCYDCARFVSVVMWEVGFPMDRGPSGWWAAHKPEDTSGQESSAWSNVDYFYYYWWKHGAEEVQEDDFAAKLMPGDTIFYGNKRGYKAAPGEISFEGNAVDLTHVVIVTSIAETSDGSKKPKITGRGDIDCLPERNPVNAWYDDVVVGNFGPVRLGLHMPYEKLSEALNKDA